MGGKNDIINHESISELYVSGCEYISKIKDAAGSIEDKLNILRNGNFSGEKGTEYRQRLNSISSAVKELTRAAEKAGFFMDTKLNMSVKKEAEPRIGNSGMESIQYLKLKK